MSIRHREMCARRRRQIQTAIKSPDGQPADQDAVSEAATSEDVGSVFEVILEAMKNREADGPRIFTAAPKGSGKVRSRAARFAD
jgi:hypothetical protein